MTLDDFRKDVARKIALFPSYRYGQAVFNTMRELFPDRADAFRGTYCDPFYNDSMAEEFIQRCLGPEEESNENL